MVLFSDMRAMDEEPIQSHDGDPNPAEVLVMRAHALARGWSYDEGAGKPSNPVIYPDYWDKSEPLHSIDLGLDAKAKAALYSGTAAISGNPLLMIRIHPQLGQQDPQAAILRGPGGVLRGFQWLTHDVVIAGNTSDFEPDTVWDEIAPSCFVAAKAMLFAQDGRDMVDVQYKELAAKSILALMAGWVGEYLNFEHAREQINARLRERALAMLADAVDNGERASSTQASGTRSE